MRGSAWSASSEIFGRRLAYRARITVSPQYQEFRPHLTCEPAQTIMPAPAAEPTSLRPATPPRSGSARTIGAGPSSAGSRTALLLPRDAPLTPEQMTPRSRGCAAGVQPGSSVVGQREPQDRTDGGIFDRLSVRPCHEANPGRDDRRAGGGSERGLLSASSRHPDGLVAGIVRGCAGASQPARRIMIDQHGTDFTIDADERLSGTNCGATNGLRGAQGDRRPLEGRSRPASPRRSPGRRRRQLSRPDARPSTCSTVLATTCCDRTSTAVLRMCSRSSSVLAMR